MAGYIGKSQGVTQVDGYTRSEADAEHTGTQTFNRTSTDGDIIDFRKDGTTVGSIGSYGGTDLTIGSGDTGLRFYAAGDKIWSYNTSTGLNSDALVTLGDTNKRFKDLYLSGGVYLGGTGSANYLDDYETGAWTPDLRINYSNTGITYAARDGQYTKIGNVCYYSAIVTLSSKGSNTGGVRLYGFPFQCADKLSSTSNENIGLFNYFSGRSGNVPIVRGFIEDMDWFMVIFVDNNATGLQDSDLTNTTSFRVSGWYFTV